MQKKILIVDADSRFRPDLEKFTTSKGLTPFIADSYDKALNIMEGEAPDIVLLDLKLPDTDNGLDILEVIKSKKPEILLTISGQSQVDACDQALNLKASDSLDKKHSVFYQLETLLDSNKKKSLDPGNHASVLDDWTVVSEKMQKIKSTIMRLSKSDISILVLGESGTGKNFLAKKIHQMSPRKEFPYVQIGCANMPDHLIESELFGHEKGAFTDAKASKQGLVELAEGGTLLFDEIGELPYRFQSKLLNVLEDKCFRKVGSLQTKSVDVRILATTNRDLQRDVEEKKFRLDLFYRLNAVTIEMPSLRERPEDILVLAESFLSRFCRKYDCQHKKITSDGMILLQQYPWPGNVRELMNLIEKLVVLSEGDEIDGKEIETNLNVREQHENDVTEVNNNMMEPGLSSGLSLGDMEKRYIEKALELANGNQRKTAELLCISRDTLRYRLKKLGIN